VVDPRASPARPAGAARLQTGPVGRNDGGACGIPSRLLSSRAIAVVQNTRICTGGVHTGTRAKSRQIGGSACGYQPDFT